jgi:hypothetical protein|tara:strand:+ start:9002 stop:9634 length:633 start_codon:yes stop_codon:yes gene_type:complete
MSSYSQLVTELIRVNENEGAEFIAYIPSMINRAEEKLTKDLDDTGLVTYTSVAVSINNNSVTLPLGTRIIKNFYIENSGTKINMLMRTSEYLNDYWPVSASTGTPKYYTRLTNTAINVAPTPSATLNGTVAHISRPVTLTSTNDNNYFTDFCYDALFYGSQIEALLFQKNYSAVGNYDSKYKESVMALRNQANRTRRDDMQQPVTNVKEA